MLINVQLCILCCIVAFTQISTDDAHEARLYSLSTLQLQRVLHTGQRIKSVWLHQPAPLQQRQHANSSSSNRKPNSASAGRSNDCKLFFGLSDGCVEVVSIGSTV
jgi:hypothetical protein